MIEGWIVRDMCDELHCAVLELIRTRLKGLVNLAVLALEGPNILAMVGWPILVDRGSFLVLSSAGR
jgi:hypothetical protein